LKAIEIEFEESCILNFIYTETSSRNSLFGCAQVRNSRCQRVT
jgi:hypothetical protein